jgi:phosphatidylglycerophosphate synthase
MTTPRDLDALLDLTTCPADRLWRYPICRVLLRPAMRVPITPNHVTALHTVLAVLAGAILTTGTTRAFFVAGLLFEARSILDCFDGVLARAKNLASPMGRAFDQLGDTIGFMSLMGGGFVCLSRAHGPGTAGLIVLATSLVAASCTAAWDFYRRSLSSLLRHGYDATEEEHLATLRTCAARPVAVLQMSRVVQAFQWSVLSSHPAPRLPMHDDPCDASADAAAAHATTALGRALQDAAGRDDPELRALLRRVGMVGGDNLIMLLTASLLLGAFVEAFPLLIVWGVAMWGYTVSSVSRYLHDGSRAGTRCPR